MNAPDAVPVQREFKNHDIVDDISKPGVRYELRPAKRPDGRVVDDRPIDDPVEQPLPARRSSREAAA